MQNMSKHSNDIETVEQWNQELLEKYLPLTVALVVYMIVGVLGNGVVLFIYFRKFKTYGEGRFYLPILAVVDLLSSVANCCFHIAETILPVMYESDIGCKLAWFFATTITLDGTLVLVLVAVNRFLMICKPFGKQMTPKVKRISVFISVVVALILSAPCFVFSGPVVVTHANDIIGHACAMFTGGIPNTVAMVFSLSLVALIFTELAVMAILYYRICRVVTHVRGDTLKTCTEVTQTVTTFSSGVEISVIDSNADDRRKSEGETQKEQPPKRVFAKGRRIPRSRITLINIVVTVAFAISFIPKLALVILESADSGFIVTDPDKGIFFMFLNSAYIFNNIVNPFIYAFMDGKFRLELKKLFCRRC